MNLTHEMKCDCSKCYAEFLPTEEQNLTELNAMKLNELAEQEGGLKQFINDELEELQNYEKNCDCEKSITYGQHLGDDQYRDVCLRCGGVLSSRNKNLPKDCPNCNEKDVEWEWECANFYDEQVTNDATCPKCETEFEEIMEAVSWNKKERS